MIIFYESIIVLSLKKVMETVCDGVVTVMDLWRVWSNPTLPLLPGSLLPRVKVRGSHLRIK